MLLLSKFNKVFLLCIVDIFNKYALLFHCRIKKIITITNTFQKILDECNFIIDQ